MSRKILILFLIGILFLGYLNAQNRAFVTEGIFLQSNYLPVTESDHDATINVMDTNNRLINIKVSELPVVFKNHKIQLLQNFPNIESTTTIAKVDQAANLSFAAAAGSHKNERYIITFSYNVFKTEIKDSISYKIGYGLRLIATVTANESNIDLGNLLKLGITLKRKKVKGFLHMEVCGLVNQEFGAWVPILLDLSEAGVTQSAQTFSTIKAKVADNATYIVPQILEIKNNKLPTKEILTRPMLLKSLQ